MGCIKPSRKNIVLFLLVLILICNLSTSFQVKSENTLDLIKNNNITMSGNLLKDGEEINAIIKLIYDGGSGIINLDLTYLITKDGKKIWSNKEKIQLHNQKEITKTIQTKKLEPGEYKFTVINKYGNEQIATSSNNFIVESNSYENISILIILLILLFTFFMFLLIFSSYKKYGFNKINFSKIRYIITHLNRYKIRRKNLNIKRTIKREEMINFELSDNLKQIIDLENINTTKISEIISFYNSKENRNLIKLKLEKENILKDIMGDMYQKDEDYQILESIYNLMNTRKDGELLKIESNF